MSQSDFDWEYRLLSACSLALVSWLSLHPALCDVGQLLLWNILVLSVSGSKTFRGVTAMHHHLDVFKDLAGSKCGRTSAPRLSLQSPPRVLKCLERVQLGATRSRLLQLGPCLEKCPQIPGECLRHLQRQLQRFSRHGLCVPLDEHPVQLLRAYEIVLHGAVWRRAGPAAEAGTLSVKQPDLHQPRGSGLQINGSDLGAAHAQSMQQIDFIYAMSLTASIALAVGAICILLFAM